MKTRKKIIGLTAVLAIFCGCAIHASDSSAKKDDLKGLVVGVFDSRAVAVAYTRGPLHKKVLQEKMEEHKKAKEAGDTEKIKKLESWGRDMQDKIHLQGFGTASVKNLLEYIKGDIPEVAKEAGVDIIVSKWDLVYEKKGAKIVDVTDLIIRGFNPDEKTLKTIKELRKHRPCSDDVIKSHEH